MIPEYHPATEVCTCVHISVINRHIAGHLCNALWDRSTILRLDRLSVYRGLNQWDTCNTAKTYETYNEVLTLHNSQIYANHMALYSDLNWHHLKAVNLYKQAESISVSQKALRWHHDERDGVSNNRRLHCLFNCLLMRRLKKTSKLRVTGPCEGNPPVTGGLPPRRGSNAENIRWRHHVQCNKAKVMKIFDGWSSEPRSGTSTSNARMAAESGWSLGTRHVDKPGTSLHPSLQWQERITFRRWINNTHPTSKHKGQGYGWLS